MLLITQSPFRSPPLMNLSLEKGIKKVSLLDFPENKDCMMRRRSWSSRVTCCNYAGNINMGEFDNNDGNIGITNFFQGKNIFITGATGFLGKVLVEKLLRSTSLNKIYLLIKAKDKEVALDRLAKEITNSELFKCLQKKHGTSYQEFLKEKLIVVAGNICEPNLGMDFDSAHALMEEVDVIIQSAANTNLTERYDLMLDANVNGPQRLMRFAKMCKNLSLFVHVSTAYVNGEREGLFFENPMSMGENRRKDLSLFPWLDIANEMNLTYKSTKGSMDLDTRKDLKRLGQERATFYGWDNTYVLTKAMGEMVVNEIKGDIPLLIIRPSIIESSYKEPFPGWIQGNRMADPAIISYGKGQLPAFFGDPKVQLDVIPVDLVVNTIIAATAKHGNIQNSELDVYHVASSSVNPVRLYDFFEFCYEYFNSTPLIESSKNSITKIKFFNNMDSLSKYTWDEICRRDGLKDAVRKDEKMVQKLQKQCKAKATYAEQLCRMYEFAGFYKARFHIGNTQKLLQEMSEEERNSFEIDVTNIDWRKYFVEIHIPGLRKYVLDEQARMPS